MDEIFISFGDASGTIYFLEMMVAHAEERGMDLREYIASYIQHLRISCSDT